MKKIDGGIAFLFALIIIIIINFAVITAFGFAQITKWQREGQEITNRIYIDTRRYSIASEGDLPEYEYVIRYLLDDRTIEVSVWGEDGRDRVMGVLGFETR